MLELLAQVRENVELMEDKMPNKPIGDEFEKAQADLVKVLAKYRVPRPVDHNQLARKTAEAINAAGGCSVLKTAILAYSRQCSWPPRRR